MELKGSYRQTEVGLIPADWEVATFRELFDIEAGGDLDPLRSADHQSETYRYPIYSNSVTNGGLYGYCSYFEHARDSITITARGTLGVATYRDHEYTAIGRVLVLQARTELSARYFTAFINNRVRFATESTGVPQLTAPQISTYRLPVPPIAEQHAIAQALHDVDDLITILDQLIAKKYDLRQGAMQQLLTGKTRLPGFNGTWKTTRLGDVTHIKTGNKNNEDKTVDGQYPLFVRSQTVERIDSYAYDCEAILVPGEGGIGSIFHYINGKFDCHQRVYKISSFDTKAVGKFVFYTMQHMFHKQATRHSVKATVDSLRLPTFQDFEFLAPLRAEQVAIAAILSDMDAELTALEQRRDKTRLLKQGMMQELLTGRTRLV